LLRCVFRFPGPGLACIARFSFLLATRLLVGGCLGALFLHRRRRRRRCRRRRLFLLRLLAVSSFPAFVLSSLLCSANLLRFLCGSTVLLLFRCLFILVSLLAERLEGRDVDDRLKSIEHVVR